MYQIEKSCRLCDSECLKPILSLGKQPLANALAIKSETLEPPELYPLNLVRCEACGLVQILETVAPETLFSNYLYFSSYAQTLVENAKELSNRIVSGYNLGPNSFVVEIGSNDGYLLQFYKQMGIRVLGIEPAETAAEDAIKLRGIPTWITYFDDSVAGSIINREGQAQVIHAHNVLAHVASLHAVVKGMSQLLSEPGIIVIEVLYIKDMIESRAFDMIYHEHLCYYSLDSLEKLLNMHELEVFHVEHISTHGGSLRVFASRKGRYPATESLRNIREYERAAGMDCADFYTQFAIRVEKLKHEIFTFLKKLRYEAKTVAAYGAAAKATVMLNYLGISSDLIKYAVDRNPHKQGRFIPGTDIEINPVERLFDDTPDYLFVTAWNLLDEIVTQQNEFYRRGGRFVIPIPELKVI